jgi:hypothetical protein
MVTHKLQQEKRKQILNIKKDKERLSQKNILVVRDSKSNIIEIRKVKQEEPGYVTRLGGCFYEQKPYVATGHTLSFDENGQLIEIGNLYSRRFREIDEDLDINLWKSYYKSYCRYNSNGEITDEYQKSEVPDLKTLDKDIVGVLKEEGLIVNVEKTLSKRRFSPIKKPILLNKMNER